jgi:hypothetical protein
VRPALVLWSGVVELAGLSGREEAQPEAELLENPRNGTGLDEVLAAWYNGLPLERSAPLRTPGP